MSRVVTGLIAVVTSTFQEALLAARAVAAFPRRAIAAGSAANRAK